MRTSWLRSRGHASPHKPRRLEQQDDQKVHVRARVINSYVFDPGQHSETSRRANCQNESPGYTFAADIPGAQRVDCFTGQGGAVVEWLVGLALAVAELLDKLSSDGDGDAVPPGWTWVGSAAVCV